jgi:hypothetical protein
MRPELCCRVRPAARRGGRGVARPRGAPVGSACRPRRRPSHVSKRWPYRRHIISASTARWMAARGELGQCARTCRRQPAVMAHVAEVLGPQPKERGSVELRVATDVVVHLGRNPRPCRSSPNSDARYLPWTNTAVESPVVPLPWQQGSRAGPGQPVCEGPAAGAGPVTPCPESIGIRRRRSIALSTRRWFGSARFIQDG